MLYIRFARGSKAQDVQYNPPNPLLTFGLDSMSLAKRITTRMKEQLLRASLRDKGAGVSHKVVSIGGKVHVKMSDVEARELVGREIYDWEVDLREPSSYMEGMRNLWRSAS